MNAYGLIIVQEGLPPAELYVGFDQATMEAAGARRCKQLNDAQQGESLGYTAVVLPVSELPQP